MSKVQVTKTRPANTTAYAENDVIADGTTSLWTFEGLGKTTGATGLIVNAKLIMGRAVSTALQAELFLFHTAVGSDADNAADTITDAELQTCIGSILFNNRRDTTTGSVYTTKPNIQFKCDDGDQAIYGILLAKNAYVPESAEVFDIVLEGIILR